MDLILYIFFFHSEAKGRTESQFIILVPSTITRNEWRTQLLFQKLKCFKPLDDLQENCKIAVKTFLVQLEGQFVYKSMGLGFRRFVFSSQCHYKFPEQVI